MKDIIEADLKRRNENIRKTEKFIKKLPQEDIIFDIHNGYPRFRVKRNGEIVELGNKKDRKLIEDLIIRKIFNCRVRDDQILKKLDENYLNGLKNNTLQYDDTLRKYPEFAKILQRRFGIDEEKQNELLISDIDAQASNPEALIFHTGDGNLVRSKSEVMIYDELCREELFFKYERPLKANSKIYFPDFTIVHPRELKIIIWEHLGKMDDSGYVERNRIKIKNYIDEGFFPGVNLIITWEDANHVFDSKKVKDIINCYLR